MITHMMQEVQISDRLLVAGRKAQSRMWVPHGGHGVGGLNEEGIKLLDMAKRDISPGY